MPRTRRADVPPSTSSIQPVGATGMKRKRDKEEASLEGAAINSTESTPRNRKRVQKAAAQSGSTESPVPSPRRRRLEPDVEVDSKTDIRISKQVNGSSVLVEQEAEEEVSHIAVKKSPARKAKAKKTPVIESEDEESAGEDIKPKKKRKTKEEKEAEAMPLATRTIGSKMFVGAHTSVAKGVENAVTNCLHIGGNAFACFLKSQRKWDNPPLQDGNRDAFRKALIEHKYDGLKHVVPHGSYLVNLATENPGKAEQSYTAFLDDLQRCETLGIKHYNFHPGGAGTSPFDEAITRLANQLNRALSETTTVVPLLENMAGHGTLIGGRFQHLRDVIAQIKPEYRSRIGVCIDTCHAFAAGYDLRSPEAFKRTIREFDEVVGMQYLKAMHLNDSKAPFNSHRDLHQNIGLGFLGLRAFHNVMNEPRFEGLPLILETPCERPDPKDPTGKKTIDDKSVWSAEIKLLESLVGMDAESQEFKALEKALSDRGKKERHDMQAQFDKKQEKEKKKLAKEREKGQKSLSDMFGAGRGKANNAKAKPKPNKTGKGGGDADDSEMSSLSDLSEDEEGHVH